VDIRILVKEFDKSLGIADAGRAHVRVARVHVRVSRVGGFYPV
jgi:hypothetical protein